MQDLSHTLLTVQDVAHRWRLGSRSVRDRINTGRLLAVTRNGRHLVRAGDMWAAEAGPDPKGSQQARHLEPLMTKRDVACMAAVSLRTVERWMAEGLPTRNVDVNVRFDKQAVRVWHKGTFGFDLPERRT